MRNTEKMNMREGSSYPDKKDNKKRRPNRSNQRGKGAKNSAKPDGKYDAGGERQNIDFFKSETNDWRWYANDPQLLKDVASMPYGYSLGGTIDFGTSAPSLSNRAIPGCMSINFVPTVGWSQDNQSAVNVAMKNMVTYMKATVSGARTYDSPDLCMYLMAIDSANMFLAWMRRLYGVTGLANMVNRYYPEALLHANGTDYKILRSQLANFRTYINLFATKLGGYVLPAFMPICARHMWLCNGYYLDGASGKNQIYITVPEGFHQFQFDQDKAGMLKFKPFISDALEKNHYLTVDEIIAFGDSLLESIRDTYGEQDFNQIAADLLATYGEANVYRPEGISDTYIVGPSYDPVVLAQFQNATAYGFNNEIQNNYDITQDPTKNFVVCMPKGKYEHSRRNVDMFERNRLILSNLSDPGPESTMENTRLVCIPSKGTVTASDTTMNFDTVGSELCTRFYVYQYLENETGTELVLSRSYEIQSTAEIPLTVDKNSEGMAENAYTESRDAVANELTTLGLLSNFDWHPTIVVNVRGIDLTGNPTYTPYNGKQIIGDINNYTIVNHSDLQRINHVALLSEFAVEKFGRGMIK